MQKNSKPYKQIKIPVRRSVLQDWVMALPFMMQSVLISSIRGADGVSKDHPSKMFCRWLRRCILISAFDRVVLETPLHPGGGSYTGPSVRDCQGLQATSPFTDWEVLMRPVVHDFIKNIDDLPHHFILHLIHAAEIVAYFHPKPRIALWWQHTYNQLCHDMHMHPEKKAELEARLNDNEEAWRNDETRYKV